MEEHGRVEDSNETIDRQEMQSQPQGSGEVVEKAANENSNVVDERGNEDQTINSEEHAAEQSMSSTERTVPEEEYVVIRLPQNEQEGKEGMDHCSQLQNAPLLSFLDPFS